MDTSMPASACAQHRPEYRRGQPPKSGYGFLKFILDTIEDLPEVRQLLAEIRRKRHNGRPGYPPCGMFRLLCLKHLLNERFNVQLLQRLRGSPKLLQICGLHKVPSETATSRFFRHISEYPDVIENATADMVNRLRGLYPDIGEIVSIDGTDIKAFANPKRNPVVDSDATWGVRTTKSKTGASMRGRKTEPFFGYKTIFLADATHNVPLGFVMKPANEGESPQLRDVVSKMIKTYDWFQPKFAVADRGFDSQRNHKFLIERGITPIIHIRKPSHGGLHDGIYSTKGAPTCLGGKAMTYIRTDADTGKHLYACPTGWMRQVQVGQAEHRRQVSGQPLGRPCGQPAE